ncbi:MAG TPA: S9 family peptidase, partial [Acidimicrobiia bacterium]|nr:S9 family peptidase [Acidimicrobiia bacterium]
MKPAQISEIRIPSDPRLSPDGTRVAYVVSTPNLEDDRNDRAIWVEGSQFTAGPGDSAPRWSPDGSRLAFLRSSDGSPAQVAIIPADGGDSRTVTSFELGVEALEWSPEGDRLVVVGVTYEGDWAEIDDDERSRRPRRIDSVPYRFDTRAGGWIHDRKRHLWLVDAVGEEEPRCLTPGEFDEDSPAWSPNGSRLAFISDRDPKHGLVSGNDVWEVDVESGATTKVTDRGFWSAVSYRPDGALHLLGNIESRYPVDAYLYRREDDGSLTDLTGHLDRSSVSLSAGPASIRWDDQDAVVGYEDAGRFGVISVAPDGTVDTLVRGDKVVTGHDAADRRLVYTASTWDSPGELISDGTPLTHLNDADLALAVPDHFTVDSDGHEIDVWVFLPDGDAKVPLLLNIHGGPASQYGYGFFDEFQVYAGAGYGVVACNPRGSAGRGRVFVRAVVGRGWGQVDHADISAAVEGALARHDRLDATRMGIMGGSYGGFMTAWMIGQEDRWSSAIVERALISWTSFSGTSDIGGVFPENYTEEAYPEAWDTWWRLGPLALAHGVTTPTLVLHSENDFRCPIEQAEQYFMALLRNGTTAELLRFPGEGHEMSRSGKPRHRVERFEAILD